MAAEMFVIPDFVRAAVSRLRASGYEAYLVGGCVRDLLRGERPLDWDVATAATPREVEAVFQGERLIGTGRKHGTVTVLLAGEPLEVTTFRVEGGYSDNRRPDSVSFTGSLEEDLARRDFTINAMAYCPERGLVDEYGGREDLARGLIRCVGEPGERFREDGLRLLRALRFAAVLGFEIECGTAEALRENRELLQGLSAERVRAELTKLLCGEHTGRVLADYAGVLAVPLPEIAALIARAAAGGGRCGGWAHTAARVAACPAEPDVRWAALLQGLDAAAAAGLLRRLKFSNAARARVERLLDCRDTPLDADKSAVKRQLCRLGEAAFRQLIGLRRADRLAQPEAGRFPPPVGGRCEDLDRLEAALREIVAEGACVSLRDLAVGGRDLLAAGYRGKEVGEALDRLLAAVVDGDVPNDRARLLQYLKRLR